MQNYNTYTNDNIARRGLQESFIQSQQIKPKELTLVHGDLHFQNIKAIRDSEQKTALRTRF